MQHYGQSVVIANAGGCEDVIYFRQTANSLLYDFYRQERDDDDQVEKWRIIKIAADLIKADIADLNCYKEIYFSIGDLNESTMLSYVPESLQFLLTNVAPRRSKPTDMKLAAIGQSIIQLARPNTILCPLQIMLGVEVHHKTGSKFVVELLRAFGFGSSSKKVLEFEKSICFHESSPTTTHLTGTTDIPLYSADILQCTIDGKNTLHLMGIIRSTLCKGCFTHLPIKKKIPSNEDLLQHVFPIRYISKIVKSEVSVLLKPISNFDIPDHDNFASKWDTLRVSAGIFKEIAEWSGFMRLLTKRNGFPGIHDIEFLPFIDLDPNNLSTIFTTLMFVIDECKKQGVEPVLTFDLPLWQKSMMINVKEGLSVTILLGNFHMQMSYLSSIGYVMKNSGILEILSTVYAENSAKKMLEGKQYERAMRAHNLLTMVLKRTMLQQIAVDKDDLFHSVASVYDEYVKSENMQMLSICDENVLMIEAEFATIGDALAESALNKFGWFILRWWICYT